MNRWNVSRSTPGNLIKIQSRTLGVAPATGRVVVVVVAVAMVK